MSKKNKKKLLTLKKYFDILMKQLAKNAYISTNKKLNLLLTIKKQFDILNKQHGKSCVKLCTDECKTTKLKNVKKVVDNNT